MADCPGQPPQTVAECDEYDHACSLVPSGQSFPSLSTIHAQFKRIPVPVATHDQESDNWQILLPF